MFKSKRMIAMLPAMTFMVVCAWPVLQRNARAYDGAVVQWADGKGYYKAYAKYYTPQGKLIDARLASYGVR